MSEWLYRVVSADDWRRAQESGQVPRCGSDERSGFVHLSTRARMLETASLYFEAAEEPVVLEIDPAALPDGLVWEEVEARGGERFPHLYAPAIPLHAVRAIIGLDPQEGGFAEGARLAKSGG